MKKLILCALSCAAMFIVNCDAVPLFHVLKPGMLGDTELAAEFNFLKGAPLSDDPILTGVYIRVTDGVASGNRQSCSTNSVDQTALYDTGLGGSGVHLPLLSLGQGQSVSLGLAATSAYSFAGVSQLAPSITCLSINFVSATGGNFTWTPTTIAFNVICTDLGGGTGKCVDQSGSDDVTVTGTPS